LYKFKEVAFYNVCQKLYITSVVFLDLYPNLALNFRRILLSLWKICGLLCYGIW